MRVLFCSLKNEYGNPKRGLAFEYVNLYGSLARMEGVKASHFAFDEVMREVGRDKMNSMLIEKVENEKPDLLFCFLYTEEIKKETIVHISQKTQTKTFNWFGDDHWRVYNYSRYWAPLFTLVSTTDSKAYKFYKTLGIKNVIKTQWAANQHLYFPQDPFHNNEYFTVSFVGQNYGLREKYINFLGKSGVPVKAFGWGWPEGVVSENKKLDIFSFSKINLNFTETPDFGWKKKILWPVKLFVKKNLGKLQLDFSHIVENFQGLRGTQKRTIKGRNFEVPACGGFLLTGDSDENLEEYYINGKEIVIFKDKYDLLNKCKYYLSHENERNIIAKAGLERTLQEHTYEIRFREIFKILGLL